MRRLAIALAGAVALVVTAGATPARACGGLVAPNGAVHLIRTTTLAAWHAGVEHYVTSFQFAGGGAEFGSIVPLPAVPTTVERGGDWTLQRLEREIAPPAAAAGGAAGAASGASAQVILETKIDALDITVLKGGGRAVGQWAQDHGFLLTPDAPELLDYYSHHSPVFLAARFDTAAASERGQQVGDGTPVHITMPLRHPWVPLRILTLGRGPTEPIDADVFMLSDFQPVVELPVGASIAQSSRASASLLSDLRADKGMAWVPRSMWFTYIHVNGQPAELRSDITTKWPAPPPPPTTRATTTTAPPTTSTSPPTVPPTTALALDALKTVSHRSPPFPLAAPAAILVLAAAVAVGVRVRRSWR